MNGSVRTAEFFDQYAARFSAIYGNRDSLLNRVVNPLLRRSMRLRYESTLAGCVPISGAAVLDIGCGPGHYAVELARRGARRVLGVDFAEGMLDIARAAADRAGVSEACTFEFADFLTHEFRETFDFVIATGFMDYAADPVTVVRKAAALAGRRAFFSFPRAGGLLAWQRKLRYRNRCDLYLYDAAQIRRILGEAGVVHFEIAPIARDFFVTIEIAAS